MLHVQVAIRESWGLRQGNADFNTMWAGSRGGWAGIKCAKCRAWEVQTDTGCEAAMWLDMSACLDESQATADAVRRAYEQNPVLRTRLPLVMTMPVALAAQQRPSHEAHVRMHTRTHTHTHTQTHPHTHRVAVAAVLP